MLAIERKNQILNKLKTEQRVLVSELAVFYAVTEETIRRDLDKLEKEGFATKTYGGAIWGNSTKTDLSYTIRNKTNVEAKNIIGELVAGIIRENTAIACTACNYCAPNCPKKIAIPRYFSLYNEYARSPGEGWKWAIPTVPSPPKTALPAIASPAAPVSATAPRSCLLSSISKR